MHPAVHLPGDQAGVLQHVEVPGHGGEGGAKGRRQLSHRGLAPGQPDQHRPARRMGQRREDPVEARGFNRYVNH